MTPFILEGRKKLPPEPAPSTEEEYDQVRQLWIDRKSGEPLVCRIRRAMQSSQYGETSVTETREGADQADSVFEATPYGETSMTKTREGADRTESSAWDASAFGKTIHTATCEGADQPEGSLGASPYGETIETRTREGADQTEVSGQIGSELVATASHEFGPDIAQLISDCTNYAAHPHF
jgi:hypothetical protein